MNNTHESSLSQNVTVGSLCAREHGSTHTDL